MSNIAEFDIDKADFKKILRALTFKQVFKSPSKSIFSTFFNEMEMLFQVNVKFYIWASLTLNCQVKNWLGVYMSDIV